MKIRAVGTELSELISSCNEGTLEGDGLSADSAFKICSESQMHSMDDAVNGVHFKLMKDLSLSVTYTPVKNFKGNFNGNSHVISNLAIYAPAENNKGLFDSLQDGANVHDLVISDSHVQSGMNSGILAGVIGTDWISQSTISNITIKNSVVAAGRSAGIVAGVIAMTDLSGIKVMNSTVLSDNGAGLFTGGIDGGGVNIDGATLQGYVSCPAYAGGAFGYSGEGTLKNIAVNANISMPPSPNPWWHNYVGLFSGYAWGGWSFPSIIEDSYVVGRIVNEKNDPTNYVGGFVGAADGTRFIRVYDAASNISQPMGSLNFSAGFLGSDWGGNDLTSSVFHYTHNNTLTESDLNVIQLDETQMKNSTNLTGFNFSGVWQMASETQFKFPILATQSKNPAFEAYPTRVKSSGGVWIEETPGPSGNTFEITTSSEFHYATLTLHNDSGSTIRLAGLNMAINDAFMIAGGAFAGTCSWLLDTPTPSLGNGSSCTIGIRFNPDNAISASEISRDGLQVSFLLSGVTETIAHMVEGEASLDGPYIGNSNEFPPGTITNQAGTLNFNISNVGTLDAEIVSYAISGDSEISLDSSNCPAGTTIIPSADFCTVTLNFAPTVIQTYTATLTITYRDLFGGADKTATITFNWDGLEHPFDNAGTAPCYAGDGTALKPFCIYDVEELDRIRNYSDKVFNLVSNIDLTGTGCNSFTPIYSFTGTIDGQGNTISNFCYHDQTFWYLGLFQYLTGNISNLNLDNFDVDGKDYVGSLAGFITGGNYDNIVVNNPIVASQSVSQVWDNQYGWSSAGGFAGTVTGRVGDGVTTHFTDCSVVGGTVSAARYNAGGFFGNYQPTTDSTVDNCTTSAAVSGVNGFVGGFAGWIKTGTVTNSSSTGPVTVQTGFCTGGFVGAPYTSTIDQSFTSSTVTAVGGLWGGVGGFVGCPHGAASGIITNSYATGDVNAPTCRSVGGFAGNQFTGDSISDSYATGNVVGQDYVGGFSGGGNGGGPSSGSITRSFATGTVTGTGTYVGGFSGFNGGAISQSFSTGSVSGYTHIGGFAGGNAGTITDSFTKDAVLTASAAAPNDYIGGFVGNNATDNAGTPWPAGTIVTSYSASVSLLATNMGGFVGRNVEPNLGGIGTITSSYFYSNGGVPMDAYATGLDNTVAAQWVDDVANYGGFDTGTPIWRNRHAPDGTDSLTPVLNWMCGKTLGGVLYNCQ